MPIQSDDRSASNGSQVFSPSQVLSVAMEGLETLHLMLGETEALANCACNSLDSLPSSLRDRSGPFPASPNAAGLGAAGLGAAGLGATGPGASGKVVAPADLTELLHGLDDDLDDDPDGEDQLLAVGRVQTLVDAEGKAIRRSYRYCRRLRQYLEALIATLPRQTPPPPPTPTSPPPAAGASA